MRENCARTCGFCVVGKEGDEDDVGKLENRKERPEKTVETEKSSIKSGGGRKSPTESLKEYPIFGKN